MPSAPAATRRVPPRTSRVPALPAFVSTRVPVPALTSVPPPVTGPEMVLTSIPLLTTRVAVTMVTGRATSMPPLRNSSPPAVELSVSRMSALAGLPRLALELMPRVPSKRRTVPVKVFAPVRLNPLVSLIVAREPQRRDRPRGGRDDAAQCHPRIQARPGGEDVRLVRAGLAVGRQADGRVRRGVGVVADLDGEPLEPGPGAGVVEVDGGEGVDGERVGDPQVAAVDVHRAAQVRRCSRPG